MKLSEFALAALKNFSTINDGIVLRRGSRIRTINIEESIFASAEVDDVFPTEFGISDLNNFLGNISTLQNPDLDFQNNAVLLSDGQFALTYRGCDPELITAPPENRNIKMGTPDVTFDLPKDTLSKLLKLAAMNSLPNLSVIGHQREMRLQVDERKNVDANSAFVPVGVFLGDDFRATFKTDNLKMLPDDYVVELKKDAFAKFSSKTRKLEYYISLEAGK